MDSTSPGYLKMDLHNVPKSSRKFLQVVRPPELPYQILDYGSWIVATIPRLIFEGYRIFEERNIPALVRLTEGDLDGFAFPAGHPEIGTVYTAHPYAEDRYCVTATFHRRVFEERLAELARVMRCAGATSLTIEGTQSAESEGEAVAKLGNGIMAVDPSLQVRAATSTKLMFSFEGGKGAQQSLPPDLLFFWNEPTWREIYDAAVTSAVREYELEIENKDDYGLTSEITGEFAKKRFNIGGKYERHIYYRLKVRVGFAETPGRKLK